MQSFSVILENIVINHTMPKSKFFVLHFCCRQYRSNFNHFDIIGPKATITPYKISLFSTNQRLVWDFLCVNDSNLILSGTVCKTLRIIGQIFLPVFNTLVWGKPPNAGLQNLTPRDIMQSIFWYPDTFLHDSRVWQTDRCMDRQTDRHSFSECCPELHSVANKNYKVTVMYMYLEMHVLTHNILTILVVTSSAVYSPAFTGAKLYCLVTEAHRCK